MTILKKPIRTCVVCRGKFEQDVLLRFKCENKELQAFNNVGRSFYICTECIEFLQEDEHSKNLKKLEKALFRECKNKDNYIGQLKEILTHVR